MNLLQKDRDDFLVKKISPKRMETFLENWANSMTTMVDLDRSIGGVHWALTRLMEKYPEFFASMPKDGVTKFVAVNSIQTDLRKAWDATDLRQREWFIFQARYTYYRYTVTIPLELAAQKASGEEKARINDECIAAIHAAPPLTAFERVMWHFHRIANRARRCANVECPAPYFFARAKGTKYCSPECAGPALREQKRIWWRTHRGKGESQ
jgi:hypothetical protein